MKLEEEEEEEEESKSKKKIENPRDFFLRERDKERRKYSNSSVETKARDQAEWNIFTKARREF